MLANMKKIRLAIVDDYELFRNELTKLIHLENDLQVVLKAENGKRLLSQLKTIAPDIILMDIRMPEMDGIEATIHVKELYPKIKIIALSQYDQEANIVEMNRLGVKSFIGKTDDTDELLKAIRIVSSGGVYMTSRSAAIVQKYLHQPIAKKTCPVNVNDLELSLLKYFCKGLSSTAIGDILHKSPRTVEKYRNDLYQKFQVHSKEELIVLVTKRGLV
jgi:DNA-binding NarL/FixJ family response regulator